MLNNRFQNVATVSRGRTLPTLEVNKVIKNTYALLSLSLVFSAVAALAGVALNIYIPPVLTLLGYIGLLMLVNVFSNSAVGLLLVFAFTGFMGLTLGPILNSVLHLANGSQIIFAAFALTGVIFFALSGYALVTRKDFSFLAGFLIASMTVVFVAGLLSFFLHVPAFHLAISCGVVLIFSGFILFETSQIIHGGQTNYILATISLYLSIYNIFVSLLHIFSAFSGRSE